MKSFDILWSRESVVITVTRLRTGQCGTRVPAGREIFLFCKTSGVAVVTTQPCIELVPGSFSPGVMRPGPEVDHFLYLIPNLKMCEAIPSLPLYSFLACGQGQLCLFFGIHGH